jgi:hypothetical protein
VTVPGSLRIARTPGEANANDELPSAAWPLPTDEIPEERTELLADALQQAVGREYVWSGDQVDATDINIAFPGYVAIGGHSL